MLEFQAEAPSPRRAYVLDDEVSGEGVVLDEVFFVRVSDFRFDLALSFED